MHRKQLGPTEGLLLEELELLDVQIFVVKDEYEEHWIYIGTIVDAFGVEVISDFRGVKTQRHKNASEIERGFSHKYFNLRDLVARRTLRALCVKADQIVGLLLFLSYKGTPAKHKLVHRLFASTCIEILNQHFARSIPALAKVLTPRGSQ